VEEDRPMLQRPSLPIELRKWCPQTAAEFGTRDFTGQVWTCMCAKDQHGSACSMHAGIAWHSDRKDPSASLTCSTCSGFSDTGSYLADPKQRICVLISGKRACGKDYVASALELALQANGFRVARCAVGSINKQAYAAKLGIDAAMLEADREFKEAHRVAMVEHHEARNAEDPEWCLKEVWQQADDASADVLLLTDFRTRQDHQWFLEKIGAEGHLVPLRIEASDAARSKRGWQSDLVKDGLYSEIDLDAFMGWSACLDNSSDGSLGLVDEWITHTVMPRILSCASPRHE